MAQAGVGDPAGLADAVRGGAAIAADLGRSVPV